MVDETGHHAWKEYAEKKTSTAMVMQMANKIITIFIFAAIPAIGFAAEIRQTTYTFQMDIVQNITSDIFVISEFPALHKLRPPVTSQNIRKTNPPLAIRVAGVGFQDGSFRQDKVIKSDFCIFPPVLFKSGSAVVSEQAKQNLIEALKRIDALQQKLNKNDKHLVKKMKESDPPQDAEGNFTEPASEVLDFAEIEAWSAKAADLIQKKRLAGCAEEN